MTDAEKLREFAAKIDAIDVGLSLIGSGDDLGEQIEEIQALIANVPHLLRQAAKVGDMADSAYA